MATRLQNYNGVFFRPEDGITCILRFSDNFKTSYWKMVKNAAAADIKGLYDITGVVDMDAVKPKGETCKDLFARESLVIMLRHPTRNKGRSAKQSADCAKYIVINDRGIFCLAQAAKRNSSDYRIIAAMKQKFLGTDDKNRLAYDPYKLAVYGVGGAWQSRAGVAGKDKPSRPQPLEVLARALAVTNPCAPPLPTRFRIPSEQADVALQAAIARQLAPWRGKTAFQGRIVDPVTLRRAMANGGRDTVVPNDTARTAHAFGTTACRVDTFLLPDRHMVSDTSDQAETLPLFDIDHALTITDPTPWDEVKTLHATNKDGTSAGIAKSTRLMLSYKSSEIKCSASGPSNGPSNYPAMDGKGVRWKSVMWVQVCDRAQLYTQGFFGIPAAVYFGLEYPTSSPSPTQTRQASLSESEKDGSNISSDAGGSGDDGNSDSKSASSTDFTGFGKKKTKSKRKQQKKTSPSLKRRGQPQSKRPQSTTTRQCPSPSPMSPPVSDDDEDDDPEGVEAADPDWRYLDEADMVEAEKQAAKKDRQDLHHCFRDAIRAGMTDALLYDTSKRSYRSTNKIFCSSESALGDRLDVTLRCGLLQKALQFANMHLQSRHDDFARQVLSGRVLTAVEAFGMKSVMPEICAEDATSAGPQLKRFADRLLGGMSCLAAPSDQTVHKRLSIGLHVFVRQRSAFVDCGISPFHGTNPWFNDITASAANLEETKVNVPSKGKQPIGTSYCVAGLPQYTCYKTPLRVGDFPDPFFPVNVQVYMPVFRDTGEGINLSILQSRLNRVIADPERAQNLLWELLNEYLVKLWKQIPTVRAEFCFGMDGDSPDADVWSALIEALWQDVFEKLYWCPNDGLRSTGHVVLCGWAAALVEASKLANVVHVTMIGKSTLTTDAQALMNKYRLLLDVASTCSNAVQDIIKRSFASKNHGLVQKQMANNRAYTVWPSDWLQLLEISKTGPTMSAFDTYGVRHVESFVQFPPLTAAAIRAIEEAQHEVGVAATIEAVSKLVTKRDTATPSYLLSKKSTPMALIDGGIFSATGCAGFQVRDHLAEAPAFTVSIHRALRSHMLSILSHGLGDDSGSCLDEEYADVAGEDDESVDSGEFVDESFGFDDVNASMQSDGELVFLPRTQSETPVATDIRLEQSNVPQTYDQAPRPLKNIGLICYGNAALQLLWRVPRIGQFLSRFTGSLTESSELQERELTERELQERKLQKRIMLSMAELYRGTSTPGTVGNASNMFDLVRSQTKNVMHARDGGSAPEMCIYLLNNIGALDASIMNEFSLICVAEMQCQTCSSRWETRDPAYIVPLRSDRLIDVRALISSLENGTSSEPETVNVKCDECKSRQDVTRTYRYEHPGKYLLVDTVPEVFAAGRKGIAKDVLVDRPLLTDKYTLLGQVCYETSPVTHYYTSIRVGEDNSWLRANDEWHTRNSADRNRGSSIVLCLYQKADNESNDFAASDSLSDPFAVHAERVQLSVDTSALLTSDTSFQWPNAPSAATIAPVARDPPPQATTAPAGEVMGSINGATHHKAATVVTHFDELASPATLIEQLKNGQMHAIAVNTHSQDSLLLLTAVPAVRHPVEPCLVCVHLCSNFPTYEAALKDDLNGMSLGESISDLVHRLKPHCEVVQTFHHMEGYPATAFLQNIMQVKEVYGLPESPPRNTHRTLPDVDLSGDADPPPKRPRDSLGVVDLSKEGNPGVDVVPAVSEDQVIQAAQNVIREFRRGCTAQAEDIMSNIGNLTHTVDVQRLQDYLHHHASNAYVKCLTCSCNSLLSTSHIRSLYTSRATVESWFNMDGIRRIFHVVRSVFPGVCLIPAKMYSDLKHPPTNLMMTQPYALYTQYRTIDCAYPKPELLTESPAICALFDTDHFACLVVPTGNTLTVYDSGHRFCHQSMFQSQAIALHAMITAARQTACNMEPDIPRPAVSFPECPQQQNGIDCGMFAVCHSLIAAAVRHSRGTPDAHNTVTHDSIQNVRRVLAAVLTATALPDFDKILEVVEEEEESERLEQSHGGEYDMDNWIDSQHESRIAPSNNLVEPEVDVREPPSQGPHHASPHAPLSRMSPDPSSSIQRSYSAGVMCSDSPREFASSHPTDESQVVDTAGTNTFSANSATHFRNSIGVLIEALERGHEVEDAPCTDALSSSTAGADGRHQALSYQEPISGVKRQRTAMSAMSSSEASLPSTLEDSHTKLSEVLSSSGPQIIHFPNATPQDTSEASVNWYHEFAESVWASIASKSPKSVRKSNMDVDHKQQICSVADEHPLLNRSQPEGLSAPVELENAVSSCARKQARLSPSHKSPRALALPMMEGCPDGLSRTAYASVLYGVVDDPPGSPTSSVPAEDAESSTSRVKDPDAHALRPKCDRSFHLTHRDCDTDEISFTTTLASDLSTAFQLGWQVHECRMSTSKHNDRCRFTVLIKSQVGPCQRLVKALKKVLPKTKQVPWMSMTLYDALSAYLHASTCTTHTRMTQRLVSSVTAAVSEVTSDTAGVTPSKMSIRFDSE